MAKKARKCTFCSKTYRSDKTLANHMKAIHPIEISADNNDNSTTAPSSPVKCLPDHNNPLITPAIPPSTPVIPPTSPVIADTVNPSSPPPENPVTNEDFITYKNTISNVINSFTIAAYEQFTELKRQISELQSVNAACEAQIREVIAASTTNKSTTSTTSTSTPSKPAEEWQTPKSAMKHVSWEPTPIIPVQNRFAALAHATNTDVIEIAGDDTQQRLPPVTNRQPSAPKPQSNFYPNQQPENQTLPPRSRSSSSTSTPSRTNNSDLPSVLIAGDSIIKHVTGYQIRENIRKQERHARPKVNVKPFLGAACPSISMPSSKRLTSPIMSWHMLAPMTYVQGGRSKVSVKTSEIYTAI